MTCQELDRRLDDWLDGALPSQAAAEVEAHLASCSGCQASARGLRQLLAHSAALPRSVAPARDLWPRIEAQISRPRGWTWLFVWGQPALIAAAAVLALGLGALVWRQQSQGIVRVEMPAGALESSARFSPVSAKTGGAAVADPVLAQAELDYEAAANALLEALQQRKGTLEPATLSGVEANLRVIDRALAEVRQALAKDPRSPDLNRMLVSTHRKKVDVLRRVFRLSTAL
jgi:predicted anti-sigma-YlaC factor YlaD